MKTYLPLVVALSAGMATAQIFCIQGITTTIAYETALKPKGTSCPVNEAQGISYYSANSAGCCTSTATAKTLGDQGAACCPCGALCTGYFPPIMDWGFNTADQLVLTPTASSGSVQTVVPTTPFHGPYTATSATESTDVPSTSNSQQSPTPSPRSSGSITPTSTATTSLPATASSSDANDGLSIYLRKSCALIITTVLLAFVHLA